MKYIFPLCFVPAYIFIITLLSISIKLKGCKGKDIAIKGSTYPIIDEAVQIVFKEEEECRGRTYEFEDLVNGVNSFNLSMRLESSTCGHAAVLLGFECRVDFQYKDVYTSLGKQICVDVLGIPESIGNRSQLRVQVSNSHGHVIGREIYSISILRPSNEPFYICTEKPILSVALLVRKSADLCLRGRFGQGPRPPSIMDTLVNNSVYMGAVSVREKYPTYSLFTSKCHETYTMNERYYLIKVDNNDFSRRYCSMKAKHPSVNFSRNKGCMELLYLSPNHHCDIIVTLYQEAGSSVNFSVPYGSFFVGNRPQPQCTGFNPNEGDIYLSVTKTSSLCQGKFVISVNITSLSQNMGDNEFDLASNSLRHLYMAVFISLIAVCLLILGLTCVCCLRMRTTRARQLARRQMSIAQRAQNSENNPGFQPSNSDFSIVWDPDNPEQLSGLPTYDDVLAISSGVNPASDAKPELPPTYDSLYSSDT